MQSRIEPPWRWGIFWRKGCTSLALDNAAGNYEHMTKIYDVLLAVGFRGTYWQYIYYGQIGGLIKGYCNNLIELHVRFFDDDTLYAEIEIGRVGFIHFSKERLFANRYISCKIGKTVDMPTLEYFNNAATNYKIKHNLNTPEWGIKNKFITQKVRRIIMLGSFVTDWKTLATLLALSVLLANSRSTTLLNLILGILLIVYVIAPKKHY